MKPNKRVKTKTDNFLTMNFLCDLTLSFGALVRYYNREVQRDCIPANEVSELIELFSFIVSYKMQCS